MSLRGSSADPSYSETSKETSVEEKSIKVGYLPAELWRIVFILATSVPQGYDTHLSYVLVSTCTLKTFRETDFISLSLALPFISLK